MGYVAENARKHQKDKDEKSVLFQLVQNARVREKYADYS